ncbi:hypothetical protein ACQ859_20425 [Roseateles chitinivorans]|uniref:hypothetical protein n=1 Tax=Roseateles chitinivorans TaxID=2917965 RepID=UPI003D66FEFF
MLGHPPDSEAALAELVRYCEDFAKQMLAKQGAFYPFAAIINQDGKMEAVGVHNGEERPQAQELYRLLFDSLNAMASNGRAKASAIAADVNVPANLSAPFPDAIRVHVRALGYSRQVYTPYRRYAHRSIRTLFRVVQSVEYAAPIGVDLDETD